MSPAAKRIEIEIIGDAKNFQNALGKASGSADGFGSSLAKLGKIAAVGLAAVGAGAVFAGGKMLKLAGDAQEVDSKMNVVFGKELPKLKKNLDAFADATGASSFKLREQAADMGALLGPLVGTKKGASEMSEQFVKLATDLGSFNNVPVDEALLAIRSGLVGEAEPLRRFGVLLNEAAVKAEALRMGLVTGNETLTEQQKVMARGSLIMAQTSQAQGDATRTAGSYTNQMKALKNTVTDVATGLGVHLLPAATAVASGLNSFINKISEADGASAKFGVALDAMKTMAVKAWDGIKAAFNAIDWGAVGQALGDGLRRALAFLAGVDYAGILRTVATAVLNAIKTAFNSIDWGAVGNAVGTALVKALNGIGKFVNSVDWNNVGQQLVHGIGVAIKTLATFLAGVDWGAVLVGLTKGIIAVLKGLAGLLVGIASALGKAIITGIGQGLANLGGWVKEKLDAIPAALTSAIGSVSSLAWTIGKSIVSGVLSGLAGLPGAIKEKVEGAIGWALSNVNIPGRSPPEHAAAEMVGKPIAAGVINGFLLGIGSLPTKISESLSKALEAGKAVIERYQGVLGDAFGKLGDFVKRAFDAKTANLLDNVTKKFDAQIAKWQGYADALTPAEKALAAMDKAEGESARAAALAAAEKAQIAANQMAAGAEKDAAQLAAEQQKQAALSAITRAGLEAQATTERTAREAEAASHIAAIEATKARELQNLEERRSQMASKLDEQLGVLQERLAKHPEEYEKIQKKINALLASYGIPMKAAGKAMGEAFAKGIESASAAVEKSAKDLARIVQKYLKLGSPAEKGPLASLNTWFKPMGPMLAKQMDGSALAGAASRMAAGAAMGGPRMAMAGAGGGSRGGYGGPERIILQLDGRTIAEVTRKEWQRQAGRNG